MKGYFFYFSFMFAFRMGYLRALKEIFMFIFRSSVIELSELQPSARGAGLPTGLGAKRHSATLHFQHQVVSQMTIVMLNDSTKERHFLKLHIKSNRYIRRDYEKAHLLGYLN